MRQSVTIDRLSWPVLLAIYGAMFGVGLHGCILADLHQRIRALESQTEYHKTGHGEMDVTRDDARKAAEEL